jgi:type I restriction enzyme S subunit
MADQTTTIPKGWKMTTLGEVAEIIMGQSPSGESYNQNKDGLPFYQGITEFGDKYVDIKTYTNQPTKIIEENSILFSVRAPVGKINFTKHKACIGRGNAGLKMKNGQQDFLYFLLKKYEKAFLSNTTGTVFDSISGGQLRGFEILIPEDREEQRAIAAVLSSLDDKIELLREENKTLEATAQAIFKEWFVHFNFPNSQGKPYKASGGRMIDSELGEIPDGWKVGRIKSLIDVLSGFAFSSLDFSQDGRYKLVTIKNVQDRYFDPETKDKLAGLPQKMPDYCKLGSGDILLSLTGNVGRVCLVNGENYILNQRVAKLKAKNPIDYAFSYLLFLQNSIFSLLQSTASGTAQQNLSPIQTKEIEIVIAERKILDLFGAIANKLIQKINTNNSQIQTLSSLRDTLLPKLMRGEIRVAGFKD